jgi:hypothetical protein
MKTIWRHWCGEPLIPNDEIGDCPLYDSEGIHHCDIKKERKQMKTKIVGIALLAISLCYGLAHANCGNDNGKGAGCGNGGGNDTTVTNGTNGSNGMNGANGSNGTDGLNSAERFKGTDLVGDFAVRLFDAQYLQGQVYDKYVFGSTPGSDVFGAGHNNEIGARIVIKLGKSYEQRRIETLESKLKGLETQLNRLSDH